MPGKTLPVLAAGPWSKSALDSLLTGCSLQWALKKVAGWPDPGSPATLSGTGYHAALEAHERQRILAYRTEGAAGNYDGVGQAGLEAEATRAVREGWDEPGMPEACAKHGVDHVDGVIAMACSSLTNWRSWEDKTGRTGRGYLMALRPVSVEPYVNVTPPGFTVPLHGYLDWVGYDHAAGEWVIIDHKTANGFGRWGHDAHGHLIEEATYTLAARHARNLPVPTVARMEWHIARRDDHRHKRSNFEAFRIVRTRTDEVAHRSLAGMAQAASNQVLAGEFHPNPSWNLCSEKWCPFFGPCQIDGHGRTLLDIGAPHGEAP